MSPTLLSALLAPAAMAVIAALRVGDRRRRGCALMVLASGGARCSCYHARNLDRLTRWAGASLDSPVPEGTGPWRPAFSALYRRVRTRVAYQRDLAHTIERFQSAAEAIPDGMVVLDTANRIKWANVRARAHLGLDDRHDVGSPLMNIVRQPEFVRFLETGDFAEPIVIESQREAGVTLAIQIVPFGVEEKLLISRDITRLEAVREDAPRLHRQRLARIEDAADGHRRIPGNAAGARPGREAARALRPADAGAGAQHAAAGRGPADAVGAGERAESAGRRAIRDRAADAPPFVRRQELSQGQHTVALDIGDAATVLGSRDELASAFGNLVSNAIRYTPAGGTITLSWRVDDNGTGVFAVTDSGIGIAPEHLPRLTERFYRIDRSRSRATGGTGLGLAIVKHVLLRHQATLEIASEPGKGSTFAVRLPARRVQRAPLAPDAPAPVYQ